MAPSDPPQLALAEREADSSGDEDSTRLPVMSSRTTALVAVAAVAAGGSLVIYVGVPSGLSLLGFKGAGISAESYASAWMSAVAIGNGGGVPAGSLISICQSIGAAGKAWVAVKTVAVTIGGLGVGAASAAGADAGAATAATALDVNQYAHAVDAAASLGALSRSVADFTGDAVDAVWNEDGRLGRLATDVTASSLSMAGRLHDLASDLWPTSSDGSTTTSSSSHDKQTGRMTGGSASSTS
eukprot:scpid92937/ scgid3175/ 